MAYNLRIYKDGETLETRTIEEYLKELERLAPIAEKTKREYAEAAMYVYRTSNLANVYWALMR